MNGNRVPARGFLLAMVAACAVTSPAASQSPQGSSRWQWIVMPYFMASSMSGTTGIGPVDTEVDVGPSEIFSHLQFGIMLNIEGRKGPWAVALDGIYMDLEEDSKSGGLTVGMQQTALELALFRRLGAAFELLAGVRYNALGASIQGQTVDRSTDQSWVDPVVGLRVGTPETNKWSFSFRGDVGGFGVGSKLAVQLLPILGYRLSNRIGLALGYRYIDQDYESDDGSFRYDMTTFGPDLRVRIYF